jgi:hypothetical protein
MNGLWPRGTTGSSGCAGVDMQVCVVCSRRVLGQSCVGLTLGFMSHWWHMLMIIITVMMVMSAGMHWVQRTARNHTVWVWGLVL